MLCHSSDLIPVGVIEMLCQVSVAAQERLGPSEVQSSLFDNFLPLSHLRTVRVPQIHSLLCLFFGAIPVLHESMHCLPLGNGEVHDLCLLTLIRVAVLQ
jgi:hypothetical protein